MFSYLHRGILRSNSRFLSDDNNANSDSLVLRNQNTALSTQHHTSAGIKCSVAFFSREMSIRFCFMSCHVADTLQMGGGGGGGLFSFQK